MICEISFRALNPVPQPKHFRQLQTRLALFIQSLGLFPESCTFEAAKLELANVEPVFIKQAAELYPESYIEGDEANVFELTFRRRA
jgi:hypothetical protein